MAKYADQMKSHSAKKNWMKDAVPKSHRGVFRAKAQRAGMSTSTFAAAHDNDSGKLGKQARLAETFAKWRKK